MSACQIDVKEHIQTAYAKNELLKSEKYMCVWIFRQGNPSSTIEHGVEVQSSLLDLGHRLYVFCEV